MICRIFLLTCNIFNSYNTNTTSVLTLLTNLHADKKDRLKLSSVWIQFFSRLYQKFCNQLFPYPTLSLVKDRCSPPKLLFLRPHMNDIGILITISNSVMFLDLKKAFDTMDHTILLGKLAPHGVSPESVNWLTSEGSKPVSM